MKKYKCLLSLLISFLYLELIFRIFNKLSIFNLSFVFILCFVTMTSVFLSLILNLLKDKAQSIILSILFIIIAIYYCAQICLSNFYGFYFQFSALALSDQVASFASDGVKVVISNILPVILFLLPAIYYIFFYHKIEHIKLVKKNLIAYFVIFAISAIAYASLLVAPINGTSVYESSYKTNNVALCINNLGVGNTLFIDGFNSISGKKGSLVIEEEVIEEEPQVIEYGYNTLDFDWDAAIENADGKTKEISEYLSTSKGTKQNEYTGYFEGKNLIMFMAESFNEIAVSEELTPTLYSLIHGGFEFNDFYSPTIYSTIGGEYMELTGLYSDIDYLDIWRAGTNSYPMGLAYMFKYAGYKTYAYHNSYYSFQDRDTYLKSIGFDNYEGCYNGLENKMACDIGWPTLDSDMINGTFDDYINDDKFMVFYATVSGHGNYSFIDNDTDNYDVSHLYEDVVRDYYGDGYSDAELAYVCGQLELEKALSTLIDKLTAAGKLDDTVIVLCGDHYPYYLDFSLMDNLAGYTRDSEIECNSSNLIIYNSAMEKVSVDKPCGTMDVLPTIYNLFGLDYDSRLIMGNDILSDSSGLVVFANGSWVTDYGKYYANSQTFVANSDDIDETEYVEDTNNKVNNMTLLSYYIMTNNYYDYIYKYKN